MASGRVCMQWTLVIYNTLSVLLGLLGTAAIAYEIFYLENEDHDVRFERIIQISAASILVFSAVMGCCGAVNGSIKVLCAFIAILCGLIVAHTWRLLRINTTHYGKNVELMVAYTWIKELVHAGAMNELQQSYECCGKKNYIDYTGMGLPVPLSCYRIRNSLRASYPFGEGCTSAVKRSYLNFYRYEKWANASLIGYEIIGIILSITLCCKLMTKTRRYSY